MTLSFSAHALDDDVCSPDEIGIYRADDPKKEYGEVRWGKRKYRKYFDGRVADKGKNQEAFDEWVLKLTEEECSLLQ